MLLRYTAFNFFFSKQNAVFFPDDILPHAIPEEHGPTTKRDDYLAILRKKKKFNQITLGNRG